MQIWFVGTRRDIWVCWRQRDEELEEEAEERRREEELPLLQSRDYYLGHRKQKLSRIGDCFLAILPISGSKRSAINLALIVGEGLAWGHHLALFGRTSQWQQFSGRWRLGGTDSDPNHEEVSSRRHVCPWSRLACRSGSPFPTRCRTHHQDSPGSPKCQPCRLPQSLSKRLFESRHSPATSHLCHLLAWVKGYIRSARRWCKIEQKQPLLNWLVVLTILKVMKVNGKDYPIYYGK